MRMYTYELVLKSGIILFVFLQAAVLLTQVLRRVTAVQTAHLRLFTPMMRPTFPLGEPPPPGTVFRFRVRFAYTFVHSLKRNVNIFICIPIQSGSITRI